MRRLTGLVLAAGVTLAACSDDGGNETATDTDPTTTCPAPTSQLTGERLDECAVDAEVDDDIDVDLSESGTTTTTLVPEALQPPTGVELECHIVAPDGAWIVMRNNGSESTGTLLVRAAFYREGNATWEYDETGTVPPTEPGEVTETWYNLPAIDPNQPCTLDFSY